MKKYQTQLDYDYKKQSYTTITEPSLTIPGQSMTVNEMMERHTRGLPVDGTKIPMWDDEENPYGFINPLTLDISERYDLLEQARENVARIKEELNDKAAKRKAADKKAYDNYRRAQAEKKKIDDKIEEKPINE